MISEPKIVPSVAGIYCIVNVNNGKIYVGSSKNMATRFYTHRYALTNNKHYNAKLQRSFSKYGEDSFVFRVLATCPREYLIRMEQWFIDTLNPFFNVNPVAYSTTGSHITKEGRLRLSQGKMGRNNPNAKLNEDQVREIRAAGGTCKDIGSTYGVSAGQVCLIRNNKAYKNVA